MRRLVLGMSFFLFKQKTAYEMRISDWSSDVCSSDLFDAVRPLGEPDVHEDHVGAVTLGRGDGGGRGRDGVADGVADLLHHLLDRERQHEPIGRASCRERVCTYVYISVVAVSLKKQKNQCTRSASEPRREDQSK